jgi:hypothetical protein
VDARLSTERKNSTRTRSFKMSVRAPDTTAVGGSRQSTWALAALINADPSDHPDYLRVLALRSDPIQLFLGEEPSDWQLPMSSIVESKLIAHLDIPPAEQYAIQGLATGLSPADDVEANDHSGLNETQQQRRALIRLAVDPPIAVGKFQRLTAERLLRSFPHGMRVSGNNMSPLCVAAP